MDILLELVELYGNDYLLDTYNLVEECMKANFTNRMIALNVSALMCSNLEKDNTHYKNFYSLVEMSATDSIPNIRFNYIKRIKEISSKNT